MPRSAPPRKPYRPRAVARPVLEKMRRDLILPCYVHIGTLMHSPDREAQSDAMTTIVTLCNFMSRALAEAKRPVKPVEIGKDVLLAIIEREKRHGVYRPTGFDLEALRRTVSYCDEQLPYLDTRRLTEALLYVDRKMEEMGVES